MLSILLEAVWVLLNMYPSVTIALLYRMLMWLWVDFSSYGGEEWRNQFCRAYREFRFKTVNICTSRSVILCRFLCPLLLTESSQIVFLICSPRFVDTFNMRENYFDISLSVILTLINIADLVLFGVWVHHKKSCWKSSIIISASLPNVLSCSEKRLVFSDPDTQFPTVGDAARKTLGRRPAIKLYRRKTQHIFSSTLYGVTKNYLSPECKAEVKINLQFKVASLLFWLLKVTKRGYKLHLPILYKFQFFPITDTPQAVLDTHWFVISNLSCPCCSVNINFEWS